jgi:putative sigma-54 modulation protein
MDIRISGRNIKVTQGLDDYTRQKVDRLDRYLPNIRDIRVDLAQQHNKRGDDMAIAQITVVHNRGAILRAEEKVQGEIHVAIDRAVDKLYAQIVRFKGKQIDRRREGDRFGANSDELATAEDLPMEEVYANIPDATEAVAVPEPDYSEFEVKRRKQVEVIAMNEAEAIEQMELLSHAFFMFYNADTGKINVLYRRHEGGYGLLEPILG